MKPATRRGLTLQKLAKLHIRGPLRLELLYQHTTGSGRTEPPLQRGRESSDIRETWVFVRARM